MKNIFTFLMVLASFCVSQKLVAQDSLKILAPILSPDYYELFLNGSQLEIENGAYIIESNDVISGTNEIVIENSESNVSVINGITTLDQVLIYRGLILGFDENIEAIAADFDGDMAVSTKDMVEMRRYILGIESEAKYANYKMIDPNFVFPSDFSPFNLGYDFTKFYFEDSELGGAPLEVKIIKSGDVNGSALFNAPDVPVERESALLSFSDLEVVSGETYEVEFTLSSINDFQAVTFGLNLEGITVTSVQENNQDILYNNQDSNIKFSFFSDHPEMTFSYTMGIEATLDGKLSDMLDLDVSFLQEVVDISGNIGGISLSANVVSATYDYVESLFSVSPNPASDFLNIAFENYVGGAVKNIELLSIDGKSIKNYKTTNDVIEIDLQGLNVTGLHFVRVSSEGRTKVEKVLIK